jgi:hypothetical protein
MDYCFDPSKHTQQQQHAIEISESFGANGINEIPIYKKLDQEV